MEREHFVSVGMIIEGFFLRSQPPSKSGFFLAKHKTYPTTFLGVGALLILLASHGNQPVS